MKKSIILLVMHFPFLAFSQSQPGLLETYLMETVLTIVVIAAAVALLATIVSYSALKAILYPDAEKPVPSASFWERFYTEFNKTAPEAAVMTSHQYDGIKELDNKLPPWWLYGFYVSIIFGVIYMLHFHVFNTGPGSDEEYLAEMAEAEEQVSAYLAAQGELIDETNVELLTEVADIEAGKTMFLQSCSACHGQLGEGGIGPNFADNYWIHGGSVNDVFAVIKYGVPEKGMIPWENQFSPIQMAQLSSYILTLPGTDPPNQKEPQGELYEPGSTEDTEAESAGPVTL